MPGQEIKFGDGDQYRDVAQLRELGKQLGTDKTPKEREIIGAGGMTVSPGVPLSIHHQELDVEPVA